MIVGFVRSLVLLSTVPTIAVAQAANPVVIPDAPTCAKCTIASQVIATIGTTDGPGALSGPRFVLADTRGRFWTFVHDSPPTVFAPDGQFIRQIGRMGPGPGEFVSPMSGMLAGDSIIVFDGPAQRATVIAPDMSIGRMIRMPFQLIVGVASTWPGETIANGNLRAAGANELPLHRVSFAGADVTTTAHFGRLDPNPMRGPFAPQQRLSPARAGAVWATEVEWYRITLWSATGEPLTTLERKPTWFSERGSMGSPTTPPTASIAAIHEDPQTGQLWVFAQVPAATWREAWPAVQPGATDISSRSIAREKLYDTRVEVLDPKAGRVVAVGAVRGMVLNALPGNRITTYVVDSADIPHINIVALRLVSP
jgi:hypothetical protein